MKNILSILLILISSLSFSQINLNKNTVQIDAVGKIKSKYIDGFIDYNDSITSVTAISYTSGDTLEISNDGRGDQTLYTYAPYNVTELWDVDSSHFEFRELNIGDEITIRVSVNVTATTNNQSFYMYFKMADGWQYSYTINDGDWSFKTAETRTIGLSMPFYIGNEETRHYPHKLMFVSDANASIVVNGFYITVKRRFY